jgi:hypothetical protein
MFHATTGNTLYTQILNSYMWWGNINSASESCNSVPSNKHYTYQEWINIHTWTSLRQTPQILMAMLYYMINLILIRHIFLDRAPHTWWRWVKTWTRRWWWHRRNPPFQFGERQKSHPESLDLDGGGALVCEWLRRPRKISFSCMFASKEEARSKGQEPFGGVPHGVESSMSITWGGGGGEWFKKKNQ